MYLLFPDSILVMPVIRTSPHNMHPLDKRAVR